MHAKDIILADIPSNLRRAQLVGGLDVANGEGIPLFEFQDMLKEVLF